MSGHAEWTGGSGRSRPKSRRAARQRRLIRYATWVCCVLSFVGTLGFLHWMDRGPRAEQPRSVESSARVQVAPVPVTADARPVFRHSIVPGGVRSSQEVADVMVRDQVVKAHYAAVNPATLRPVQLSAPLNVHASYRIGNNVYWTKKPLTVAAGEFVLTDGSVTLRAQCGNMLSIEPLGPTLHNEPDPQDFDLFDLFVDPAVPSVTVPSISLDSLSSHALMPVPARSVPGYFQGGPPPDPGESPAGVTPFESDPPLPVPEPATWTLVGIGLAAAGLRRYFRRSPPE